MIKLLKIIAIPVLIVFITVAITVFCIGCKSLEVYDKDKVSECNDFYTILDANLKSDNKDFAFAATVYQECMKARQQIRQNTKDNHCKELIYGTDGLDKKNYEKYSQYLECSK